MNRIERTITMPSQLVANTVTPKATSRSHVSVEPTLDEPTNQSLNQSLNLQIQVNKLKKMGLQSNTRFKTFQPFSCGKYLPKINCFDCDLLITGKL